MTWFDEAIPMLRFLVNDYGDEPVFTDNRLKQALIAASYYIVNELSFDYTYVPSFQTLTVSPDPLTNEDYAFINFATLKAACLTDQNQVRAKALLEGIKVNCGPAGISVGGHLAGFLKVLEVGACKSYEELKMKYMFGDRAPARGIFGPFVNNKFDSRSLGYSSWDDRHRY